MDLMKTLIEYGKRAHADGLVIGAGGNISAKDKNHLIIKKKGADMSAGDENCYVRLIFSEITKGLAEEREGSVLSSETPLHIACYRADSEAGAVIHVHPPYIIAASGKAGVFESPSYEFECILGGSVPVIEYIQPGSLRLAEAVAGKIKEGASAVMLKRHGAISVGKDLEEAYIRILALERGCITYLHSN